MPRGCARLRLSESSFASAARGVSVLFENSSRLARKREMSSANQDARPEDGGEDGGASLQAQNEALRAQVAELQARNEALQKENVELRRNREPPAGARPRGARARPREPRREVAHEGETQGDKSEAWQAVERGERLTTSRVYELYPSISRTRLEALPCVVAQKPTIGCNVNTYLPSDVEALAAQTAAELADPTWQAVERGERLTKNKAYELYPCLSEKRLRALDSVVARQPKIGSCRAQNVNTYLRTDVEALAAKIAGDIGPPAPKRPRVQKAPQSRVEKTPPRVDACPVCLKDLGDGATALVCGHRIHASCLEEYSQGR